MAVPLEVAPEGSDLEFLENSYLTYTVPSSTNVNIEETLKKLISRNSSAENIKPRKWLFFDETVDVFLILQAHGLDHDHLLPFSQRLFFSIQAQIVNNPAPDRDSTPAAEVIYNGSVENVAEPLAMISSDDGQEDGHSAITYFVWKHSVFLTRPRMRLFGPSVVFSISASLKPDETASGELQNGNMESGIPSGMNLLESFDGDSMLGGVKPRLSALRVSRVAPVTQTRDSYPMLRGLPKFAQKVYPAVHTRVRFARPTTVPPSPTIIALLEIDFTPYFDCEITVEKISLSLPDGHVDDLNNVPGLSLPLTCVAHDHLTFLYRLAPLETDIAAKNPTRELFISVECTALISPEEPCTPKLNMAWASSLDFTLPLNPGFGTGVTKSFQRAHRPSQLSIGGGNSLVSPSVARPDSLPSLEEAAKRTTETPIPDFGITMTFTAPEGPIYPGDEFVWTVFVVNRITQAPPQTQQLAASATAPAAARKLALLPVPRRRRNELRVLRPPSTAGHQQYSRRKSAATGASTTGGPHAPADAEAEQYQIADAVLDENIVHAMQRNSLVDSTEVVCLSADVRVGPLAPNACHVVELRFLALREGILGLECIRVMDLGNQEHVEIRELPVMVVERRKGDKSSG